MAIVRHHRRANVRVNSEEEVLMQRYTRRSKNSAASIEEIETEQNRTTQVLTILYDLT